MSDFQNWHSLAAETKRQAAPDMLDGKQWMFYGRVVENPGTRELRRWLPAPAPTAYRSNIAKREAVIAALKASPKRSSIRRIAGVAGVSHTFAGMVARSLSENFKK